MPAQIRAICLTVASFVGDANKFFCKQVQSSGAFLANPSSGCLCSLQASPLCQAGFTGLHTVCRFPVLCRFLAPTSCCLWQGNALHFIVCSIFHGWAAKELSVISPHAVQNTVRLCVRDLHHPTPVRIFSISFFPSHMGLLCLLYGLHFPPIFGKCVTASGLASAPGTKPGTSRVERMLNSSEFTSSLRVA